MYQATCTRTYDNGEPCLGEIEDSEDGTLECSVCYAISPQLVRRHGELLLVLEGSLCDTVLDFQTNNIHDN